MEITLKRYIHGIETTIGLLEVDNGFQCSTLEDEYRAHKIPGVTRIPPGRYEIKLRIEGGLTKIYESKFGSLHRGMLHLQDVPHFEYIYIHLGNFDENTDGCILVAEGYRKDKHNEHMLINSLSAYKDLYAMIAEVLEEGDEKVFITITDASL